MASVLDDDLLSDQKKDNILEIVQWWEFKRRFWYNVIIGITGVIGLVVNSHFFTSNLWDTAFLIISYAILMNACYCLGWGLDILERIYIKKFSLTPYRNILFIVGTIISALFTLLCGLVLFIAQAFSIN